MAALRLSDFATIIHIRARNGASIGARGKGFDKV